MFTVPYATDTVRIPNGMIQDNETADNPTEFDLVPAWGADLARMKSLMIALMGVTDERELATGAWNPQIQDSVIKAFETGAAAFVNTVAAVRGLSIPARMALRAGIIDMIPAGQTADTLVPITTGGQFTRIAAHPGLTAVAMFVAFKVVTLSDKQIVEGRLFAQPSGSGGPATAAARTTTAGSARRTSRRRGTAASQATTASQPPGTSDSKPS